MKEDTTRDRLMKIETTLDYIKESQDENKKEHQEILAKLEDMDKRSIERITELDKRYIADMRAMDERHKKEYANKTAEYISYGLVTILVTTVLYALLRGLVL